MEEGKKGGWREERGRARDFFFFSFYAITVAQDIFMLNLTQRLFSNYLSSNPSNVKSVYHYGRDLLLHELLEVQLL